MKLYLSFVTLLFVFSLFLPASCEFEVLEDFLDDGGKHKVHVALEQFFNDNRSFWDIYRWLIYSPEVPKYNSAEDYALNLKSLKPEDSASPDVAAAQVPHTDGQGLQMPSNKHSIDDWWKGDPNDPRVLFKSQLGFDTVAFECQQKNKYYYRTYDGTCNWVDDDNWIVGRAWRPFQRDTPFGPAYSKVAKGHKFVPYSRPVAHPNPREISKKFFANESGIHINHTPVLTGLIEFIIHDVTWSKTTKEAVTVPIPCGDYFNPEPCATNANFIFNMTERVVVDGVNGTLSSSTSWVDASAIYGVDPEQNQGLRSGINGKLKVQQGPDGDYPPFNEKGPHKDWFNGGDQRVNQDWYVLSIQTLWVREHNRLCDIISTRNPTWNDEQVFLTAREVITVKLFLIALAYMRGYFIMPEMKKLQPIDDSLQLVRLAYGYNYLEVNPLVKFAKLGLNPAGTGPAVVSDEMSVGYRFHDLIPHDVPLYGPDNTSIGSYEFLQTIYKPKEFLKHGVDAVLRGAINTVLPGFHSGVMSDLRNAEFNLGDPAYKKPFDIAMWSVLRERTRGLPSFNEYFRYWNGNSRHLQVKIREDFSDFTDDPALAAALRSFYDTVDDVDLVVGLQLDQELFPGMQIPKSFVIVSLLSLYSLGISDRHGPLFNLLSCVMPPNSLVDCRTTNALQDLIWPVNTKVSALFPNARWIDTYWVDEIDYEFQGALSLWRLISRNTNVKCVPMNPLFVISNDLINQSGENPYNPVVCTEYDWKESWKKSVLSG